MKRTVFGVALLNLFWASLPTISVAEEEGAASSIAAQQKEQIRKVMADVRASSKAVVDTVVSEPQKAIDGGCLSNIQGIDLSAMSVDPTDIWGAVYRRLKDEIMSLTCSAAEDWVNEQTAMLDVTLESDIGTVSLSQGSTVDDWQSVQRTDVELSNDEVAEQVTTETLGEIPGLPTDGRRKRIQSTSQSERSNPDEMEKNLEETFNLKQIWGEREK